MKIKTIQKCGNSFDHLITKARTEAKKVGLKKSDIQKLIKKVRKEKK